MDADTAVRGISVTMVELSDGVSQYRTHCSRIANTIVKFARVFVTL